jgi:hypothetical protein
MEEGKYNKTLTMSGCSIAAPIMAAIAATYLQYVRWKLESPKAKSSTALRALDRLFETDGMLALFSETTRTEEPRRDREYLNPWQLFPLDDNVTEDEEIWSSRLVTAVNSLQKRRAA